MKKSLKTKAFTLIEVLVVTAVISLLASITNSSLTEARNEAKDKKKIEESNQVNTALEIQRNKTGSVPPVSTPGSYVAHNERSSEYQGAMKELVDNEAMPEIPRSDNGKDYFYLVDESGNGVFGAILESDSAMEDSNGCYFTDHNVGCSGDNASYENLFDRDSLISKADECEDNDSCDGLDRISPDVMVVDGASNTPDVNDVYIRADNDVYGKPSYAVIDSDWQITWSVLNQEWLISNSGSMYYKSLDDTSTPDTASSWESFLEGTDPAPTVSRGTWDDIDEAGIDRDSVPLME